MRRAGCRRPGCRRRAGCGRARDCCRAARRPAPAPRPPPDPAPTTAGRECRFSCGSGLGGSELAHKTSRPQPDRRATCCCHTPKPAVCKAQEILDAANQLQRAHTPLTEKTTPTVPCWQHAVPAQCSARRRAARTASAAAPPERSAPGARPHRGEARWGEHVGGVQEGAAQAVDDEVLRVERVQVGARGRRRRQPGRQRHLVRGARCKRARRTRLSLGLGLRVG